MSKKKQGKKAGETTSFIKDIVDSIDLSEKEIVHFAEIDHPLFSFKYLKDVSIDKCKDASFFRNFLMRLQKLSELGWNGIRQSNRHAFGIEKIPVEQIIPSQQLPDFITREGDLDIFRATGDKHVFVGLQQGKIFYIFFIEASFGDVYKH